MSWLHHLFLGRKTAVRPIRNNFRLQVEQLEDRWVPAITITTTSPLPAWTANRAGYSQTIETTGSSGTETFSVSAGSLPTGLTLDSNNGAITGTPTTAVVADPFTIMVTDTGGDTPVTQGYTLTINPALTFTTAASLPPWTLDIPGYSQQLAVTGGTGTDTFAVTTGSLPTGLSMNKATGLISGTPTKTVSADAFTITATDSIGATGTLACTLTINAAITLGTSLPGWTVNEPGYHQPVTVTGGTSPYTFSFTGGTLPTGLSLNTSTGVISGTPTVEATYSFQITATDSLGATGSGSYSVTIGAPLAITTASPLPTATANVAGYSETIGYTGGTGTPIFSYTGTLPPGLPLSTAGVISGTPTTAGMYNFTITATDTGGASVSQAYTLKVNPGSALQPMTLPNWTANQPGYSQTITVTNNTAGATYTYNVTTGTLPTGLSLNASTGAITGTPTKAATYTFTITATNSSGTKTAQSYTVIISPALVIKPTTLPYFVVGKPYSETITTSGGSGSVTLSYTVYGTLPPGITIKVTPGVTPTLTISGTPRNDDYATIEITATDSTGDVVGQGYVFSLARRRGGA